MTFADTGTEFGDLFTVYEWVMIAVTAIVVLSVVFVVARYRRRGDVHPAGRDKHTVVESLYALGLTAVAIVLVTLTFRTEDTIDRVADQGGVRVDITAFQWQ